MSQGGMWRLRPALNAPLRHSHTVSRILLALAATLMFMAATTVEAEEFPIARAFFSEARARAEIGDWGGAAALLEEARQRDGTDSDIRYLSALCAVKNGLSIGRAVAELDAALAALRFTEYTERDARLLEAELLVRLRRWNDALSALGPPTPAAILDPDHRWLRARAFLGLGDRRAFIREIDEALRRFPNDVRFARLFLAREDSMPSDGLSRELGGIILSRLSRYALVDPEMTVLAAPLMPTIEERRDAVLAYVAAGGKSPKATLKSLEYGLIDELAAAKALFDGSRILESADLASLLALLRDQASRDAVASLFSAFTGGMSADRDGDGLAEESWSLSRGLVTEWRQDADQDGIPERSALFRDGLPVSMRIERGDRVISVMYGSYPRCDSVSFVSQGKASTYNFAPEGFTFEPLAFKIATGTGRGSVSLPIPVMSQNPTETACSSFALNLLIERAGRGEREVVQLDRGIPVRRSTYAGKSLLAVLEYERGRPTTEKVDMDDDGRFETERRYLSSPDSGESSLAWTRVDTDGDGLFDYREEARPPFRKEWDLDGDGGVDAIQYQLPDGSSIREFSSRLDGVFDESMTIRDGRIVSFTRDGEVLRLVPDSNPVLTWIGSKPFDLGSNLPRGEGVITSMSKRIRIMRVGDRAFAELVP